VQDHSVVWLEVAVEEFAREITETMVGVFAVQVDTGPVLARPASDGTYLAGLSFALDLRADGARAFRLEVFYTLTSNTGKTFVAVNTSKFLVYLAESNEPLFHYDYERRVRGQIPGAHINVHHHRGDLREALSRAGREYRGARYRKRLDKGEPVSDSELHFPVGGSRFWPALEDVAEFMIIELGVEHSARWKQVVHAGRQRWRERQLRAAVSDDPMTAAEELRNLGFVVTDRARRERNMARLTEW
jgi:hypothetical protein